MIEKDKYDKLKSKLTALEYRTKKKTNKEEVKSQSFMLDYIFNNQNIYKQECDDIAFNAKCLPCSIRSIENFIKEKNG